LLLDRVFSAPAPPFLTGVGMVTVASALLAIEVRTRHGQSPSQYVALVSLLSALVVTIGYVFQEPILYNLPIGSFPALGMALPSAIGLALLSIGVLCALPDTGIMAPITSTDLGGAVARRFLVATLLAPAIGLVGMAGARARLWPQEVAEAFLGVTA